MQVGIHFFWQHFNNNGVKGFFVQMHSIHQRFTIDKALLADSCIPNKPVDIKTRNFVKPIWKCVQLVNVQENQQLESYLSVKCTENSSSKFANSLIRINRNVHGTFICAQQNNVNIIEALQLIRTIWKQFM